MLLSHDDCFNHGNSIDHECLHSSLSFLHEYCFNLDHGNSINLDWTAFNLENANNCIYDWVKTYEPGTETERGISSVNLTDMII